MSRIDVAYGKGTIALNADPAIAEWTVIRPRSEPAHPDPAAGFQEAVANPIASEPLNRIIRSSDRVAIATSDGTRPVPNELLIPWLLDVLPCPAGNVTVVIGTGTHRPNTESEIARMFGQAAGRVRIVNHDAFDPCTNVELGAIASGTRAVLDRAWIEADKRIVVGFVEPHFFAGFSGGAKGVAPGIAAIETILGLHRADLIGDSRSTWGQIEDNPIQGEIAQIVAMCPPDFLVNVTLNGDKAISGFYLGDYIEAHRRACTAVRAAAMQPVAKPYPVVVTSNSGFPLDQNLYQTVKGISAAARIVEDGGTILVASECSDGVPDHGNFAKIMRRAETVGEVLASIYALDRPILDQWQAQILAAVLERASVKVKSELSAVRIKECKLEAIGDLDRCVRESLANSGDARVAVLPAGPLTIPCLEDE